LPPKKDPQCSTLDRSPTTGGVDCLAVDVARRAPGECGEEQPPTRTMAATTAHRLAFMISDLSAISFRHIRTNAFLDLTQRSW